MELLHIYSILPVEYALTGQRWASATPGLSMPDIATQERLIGSLRLNPILEGPAMIPAKDRDLPASLCPEGPRLGLLRVLPEQG